MLIPAPLDRFVDGLRGCEVVPQPRYPELPSSLYVLDTEAAPTPGTEGSLFGLNPYSSTSLRRSSSASLLALRLLHHHIRTQIIRPTETTGTTTATAIVLPAESPEEPDEAAGLVARPVLDPEEVVEATPVVVVWEACVADEVDVIMTVVGGMDVVVLEDVDVELDDVVVEVEEVVVVVDDDDDVVVVDEVVVVLVELVVDVVVGGRVVEVDDAEVVVDVGFGDTAANIE